MIGQYPGGATPARGKASKRQLATWYVVGGLVPVLGVIFAIYVGVTPKLSHLRRHAARIGATALLVAVAYAIGISVVNNLGATSRVERDLVKSLKALHQPAVSAQCSYESGNLYTCQVNFTDGPPLTVDVGRGARDQRLSLAAQLASAFFGLLLAAGAMALLYHPRRAGGGPTFRLLIYAPFALLALTAGYAWLQSTVVLDPGVPRLTGYAVGWTVGIGVVWWRRTRASRSKEQRPTTTALPQAGAPTSLALRIGRTLIRGIDYALAVAVCFFLLFAGAYAMKGLRPNVIHALSNLGPSTKHVATELILLLSGFAYSQVVSNGAIAGLTAGLAHDWRLKRRSQYVLLATPFVAVLPFAFSLPGLLLGSSAHLVGLYAGLRWTDSPPAPPLATLRSVFGQHHSLSRSNLSLHRHPRGASVDADR